MKIKNNIALLIIPILLLFLISSTALSQNYLDLEYRSTDIKDVVRSLAIISGRNIVVDDTVQGRVTVQLEQVTFYEAFTHLLNINDLDYRVVDDIFIVAESERIAELYDEIVREIYELNYLEPERGVEILADVYPDVSASALTEQSRLVLFGREDRISNIFEFIEDMDQPSQEEVRVFNVNYQSADDIADYITQFFPDLIISSRDAVGDIIVSGQRRKISDVEDLINDLDIPDRTVRERYSPRELSAEELLEEINISMDINAVDINVENRVLIIEGPARQVNQIKERLPDLDNREEIVENRKFQIDYLPLEDLEEIVLDFEPDLELSKNPTDRTLIVRAKESVLDRVDSLISEVDQPRRQVMLEARIEEISHTALKERGIDVSQVGQQFQNFTTIGLDYDGGTVSGVDFNLPDLFSFYDSDSATKTLANPRLLTLDGEEASLVIADQVPIKVAEEETEAGRIVPVYEYRDVGIILNFVPTITRDDTITLDMRPEISSLGGEAAEATLPTIRTRELESRISLRDGQTFAIGGLIQDDFEERVRSIPLLSELPLLESLFSTSSRDNERTEVIIYITPKIIDISEDEYSGDFNDSDSIINLRDEDLDSEEN